DGLPEQEAADDHDRDHEPVRHDRPPRAGADRRPLEGVLQDGAPGDDGGVFQAEEGQRGLQVDRDRNGEHGVGHQQRADLRQDVPGDDPRVAGPDRLGALDVYPFLQAHDLGADDPRGGGPLQDADHDDHVEQARPPEIRDHHGEHQVGDDQQVVGHSHQAGVDPAAEIPGQDADPAADHDGHERGGEPDHERDATALHELAEHVDAAVVAAEPVAARRRRVDGAGLGGRAVGRDVGAM